MTGRIGCGDAGQLPAAAAQPCPAPGSGALALARRGRAGGAAAPFVAEGLPEPPCCMVWHLVGRANLDLRLVLALSLFLVAQQATIWRPGQRSQGCSGDTPARLPSWLRRARAAALWELMGTTSLRRPGWWAGRADSFFLISALVGSAAGTACCPCWGPERACCIVVTRRLARSLYHQARCTL